MTFCCDTGALPSITRVIRAARYKYIAIYVNFFVWRIILRIFIEPALFLALIFVRIA